VGPEINSQSKEDLQAMEKDQVQIVYTDPGGEGYHCVYYMARLAAKLFECELVVLHSRRPSLADKIGSVFTPRKTTGMACLLICPSPTDLNSVLLIESLRKDYGRVVAWVFDSFWTSNIPTWMRVSRIFDHVFVTEREDIETWRRKVRAPVDWLPWGSDVLNLGSRSSTRRFDLLRFGRQPAEWDDDVQSARCSQSRGMTFHGRPPSFSDASDNERALMRLLGETKFTVAFSNRVSRSIQTHPGREYITGRWTDALAAGAIVAGIPPHSESVQSLLWPEALLDLGTVNQVEGLEILGLAISRWTPARAHFNYAKSLELLDWRWRFKTVAEALDIRTDSLDQEVERLCEIIHHRLSASRAS